MRYILFLVILHLPLAVTSFYAYPSSDCPITEIYFRDGRVLSCDKAWRLDDKLAFEKYGAVIEYPVNLIDMEKTLNMAKLKCDATNAEVEEKHDKTEKNLDLKISKEDFTKTAEVYPWGDVIVVNILLDRDYSINEINSISNDIKYDIYYRYDLKKYPVCLISYFTQQNKIINNVDPWEVKGWTFRYVINKQMKQEFLYQFSKGKTTRIK